MAHGQALHLADDLKPAFDQAATEGMTRLFWHEFTSSPEDTGLPGQEYFAGTHLNPKITWWADATPVFDYMARIQFLLVQGVPVDDALYFYGDNVPAFVRLKADDPARVLPGYDYDVTNLDALTRTIALDGGRLEGPRGLRWRLLVLPRSGTLPLALLHRVEAFVRAGGAVAGARPDGPTGLASAADRAAFAALADRLWAGCTTGATRRYGAGTLRCDGDGRAALTDLGVVPDFVAPAGVPFDYIHRRTPGADIYFVRNAADRAVAAAVQLRVNAAAAERWDPLTATTAPLPIEPVAAGRVRLTLSLPAHGSTFVVLPRTDAPPVPIPEGTPMKVASLAGPWTIAFQPDRGAPPGSLPWPALTDWTASPDPRVRFFSGTATYRTTMDLTAMQARGPLFLHFDRVRELGVVRINGRDAGTVWAEPYRLQVGSLLHAGRNMIEVRVSNLWINRVVGDLQPGATDPVTRTNVKVVRPDQPLAASGIVGEVRLERN